MSWALIAVYRGGPSPACCSTGAANRPPGPEGPLVGHAATQEAGPHGPPHPGAVGHRQMDDEFLDAVQQDEHEAEKGVLQSELGVGDLLLELVLLQPVVPLVQPEPQHVGHRGDQYEDRRERVEHINVHGERGDQDARVVHVRDRGQAKKDDPGHVP
eukprot:CAMPEP_0175722302 /NCGR_PEP_ID=MMETSP0097-20121207/46157_2 /TAXON_ID=311494 /ORGANISM="Alexandrium monilatum, Strain CCMP3105" /LENGTH=156 /DNA_ID=CAMNT_0017030007 /DNA_START=29 /DNA_END=497 /DNA_ORIENTATION=-